MNLKSVWSRMTSAAVVVLFTVTFVISPAYAADNSRRVNAGDRADISEVQEVVEQIQNVIDSGEFAGVEGQELFLNTVSKNLETLSHSVEAAISNMTDEEIEFTFSELMASAKASGNQELVEAWYETASDDTLSLKEKVLSLSNSNARNGLMDQVREEIYRVGSVNGALSDIQSKLLSKTNAGSLVTGVILAGLGIAGVLSGLAWFSINGFSFVGATAWVGPMAFVAGGGLLLIVGLVLIIQGV